MKSENNLFMFSFLGKNTTSISYDLEPINQIHYNGPELDLELQYPIVKKTYPVTQKSGIFYWCMISKTKNVTLNLAWLKTEPYTYTSQLVRLQS